MIFRVTISWLVSVFLMSSFLFKYQIGQEQRLFYSLLYPSVHSHDWRIVGAPQVFVERIKALSYKMYFIKAYQHYKCIDFKIYKIFIYYKL